MPAPPLELVWSTRWVYADIACRSCASAFITPVIPSNSPLVMYETYRCSASAASTPASSRHSSPASARRSITYSPSRWPNWVIEAPMTATRSDSDRWRAVIRTHSPMSATEYERLGGASRSESVLERSTVVLLGDNPPSVVANESSDECL